MKPTRVTLCLSNRLVKVPKVVVEDMLIQIGRFVYPINFIILDTNEKEENLIPIILGRAFLAISNVVINCKNGHMQLTFGSMTLDLNIFKLIKH